MARDSLVQLRNIGASRFSVLVALIISLLTGGCQKSHPDYFGTTKPLHPADTLWTNLSAEPEWIDPGLCSGSSGGEIIWNIFAGLVEYHPQTLEPMPNIARGWDKSDDGRLYTFRLRKTKWNDGTPLTASDFEWSWKRVLNPQTGAKYASMCHVFQNGKAYNLKAVFVDFGEAEIDEQKVRDFVEQVAPVGDVAISELPRGAFVYPIGRRGLAVSGLSDDTNEAKLKAFAAKVGPVDKVIRIADTSNGFIYFKGNHQTETPLLKQALEELNGAKLDGQTVSAKFADGSFAGEDVVEEIQSNRKALVEKLANLEFGGVKVAAEVATSDMVGVRAIDDLTLEVRLENPVGYFLDQLCFYTFMPVPKHCLEEVEKKGLPEAAWTRPENIVTNGAYTLAKWEFRQYMIMEKNPLYWNTDEVKLDHVRALFVESYNTSLNLYKAGEFDCPAGNVSLPAEFMDHLKQFKDYRNDPYLALYFYWFNTKVPPTDNPKVRKALSLAIDRQSITDYITRAGQTPTADLIPPMFDGYESRNTPIFDLEKAKQLLSEAGYPDGKGMPTVTLTYNTSEGHKQIAEAIQQMWKDNLGIDAKIENQEWKVYLKNLQYMNFQIGRLGWICDFKDPFTLLELLSKYNGNNHSLWANDEFEELLHRGNTHPDPQERMRLLREAEAMAMEEQPLLPIYVYTRAVMVKPFIRGYWGNGLDRHEWKWLSIDERYYDGVPDELLPDPPPPLRKPE